MEREIRARGIDITLVPGAELTLSLSNLVERVASEPWLTIGGQGQYVLLESAYHIWPDHAEQLLYQLSLRGITTIIAHPERYSNVQQNPRLLEKAVERGALLQITARSLVGQDERATKQCSLRLLKAGLVSLVSSDAHSARGTLPGEVAMEIASVVGEAAARTILVDMPRLVLAGKPAPPPPLPEVSHTKGLAFWPFRRP